MVRVPIAIRADCNERTREHKIRFSIITRKSSEMAKILFDTDEGLYLCVVEDVDPLCLGLIGYPSAIWRI